MRRKFLTLKYHKRDNSEIEKLRKGMSETADQVLIKSFSSEALFDKKNHREWSVVGLILHDQD